jgi:hypothetical protein
MCSPDHELPITAPCAASVSAFHYPLSQVLERASSFGSRAAHLQVLTINAAGTSSQAREAFRVLMEVHGLID